MTVHSTPLKWTEAKRVCAQSQSHLVTVDCGEKQKWIRALLASRDPSHEYWIGYNSRQMYWEWDRSESSAVSYLNFRRSRWPDIGTCVYLDRSRSKTWRGSNCRRPRPFICEKDNIYPEYDLHSYNIKAKIDDSGLTSVDLETIFELKNRDVNQKDIPFTILVPVNAVITEFSMKMNEEKVHATIEDCKTCSQDFIKSIHSGNVTSKLRRSKVLDGGQHRVLTVSASILE